MRHDQADTYMFRYITGQCWHTNLYFLLQVIEVYTLVVGCINLYTSIRNPQNYDKLCKIVNIGYMADFMMILVKTCRISCCWYFQPYSKAQYICYLINDVIDELAGQQMSIFRYLGHIVLLATRSNLDSTSSSSSWHSLFQVLQTPLCLLLQHCDVCCLHVGCDVKIRLWHTYHHARKYTRPFAQTLYCKQQTHKVWKHSYDIAGQAIFGQ